MWYRQQPDFDVPERLQYVTVSRGSTTCPCSERIVLVNSLDDWCIFAPPEPGPDSVIGNTERIEVAWCLRPGYGTRLIPDGAITGAHFVQTPDYVQVTGIGDLTMINIPQGDEGGELDPHGADGNGESGTESFICACCSKRCDRPARVHGHCQGTLSSQPVLRTAFRASSRSPRSVSALGMPMCVHREPHY